MLSSSVAPAPEKRTSPLRSASPDARSVTLVVAALRAGRAGRGPGSVVHGRIPRRLRILAVPDAAEPAYVVMAARPYSIRFTATEINRLAAVLDCRRRLIAARTHPIEKTLMRWSRGLASNA